MGLKTFYRCLLYKTLLILKALSLTPMAKVFILWSWIGIPKNERQSRDLLWYSLDGEVYLTERFY